MPTYFTSDHHFGHAGALGLYQRPFASVAEMDRQMIDRWNSVIGRTILAAGAVVALLVAPLSGALSDRSQHRHGRRRLFLIAGSSALASASCC